MNKQAEEVIKKQSQIGAGIGAGNTQLAEILPVYNETEAEKVIEGQNNTYIVLGRDRPADIFSGYGGAGVEKCGSIDIVTGRTSAIVRNSDNGDKIYTDPSIPYDASRITISQKTDVDDNFYLPGYKSKGKSAVSIKSDNVRIIAREGIKLVTNIDAYDSLGDKKITKKGIELYATDGKLLQSMVKGENLSELISEMFEQISKNTSEITSLYKILLSLMRSLSQHTHPTSTGITSPSIELISAISKSIAEIGMHTINNQKQQTNNSILKVKYLTKNSSKCILSKYHKLD